jgi:hypothetical protein
LVLGEVEIAENLVPRPDRDAKKTGHRGVARRKAGRSLIVTDLGQPNSLGPVDQRAEDTASLGQLADLGDGIGVHADVDELLE